MHDFNVFENVKRIDFYKNIKVHKDMEYLNKSMIVEGHKKSVCPFKENSLTC